MKHCLLLSALLAGAAAAPTLAAKNNPGKDAQPAVPPGTVQLILRPAAAPVPALKVKLLPEVRDLKQGNAVVLYYRAFSPEWATHRQPEVAKLLDAWMDDMHKAPGKDLAWVRQYRALEEIDLGARRTYADWELIDRLRKDGYALELPDLQSFRTYGALLALRARFEMEGGQLDRAAYTLQTGLTLGRHVSDGPIIIQALVGAAIANITLDQVEEFIQVPGSPNLYWALTQLPIPFIDLRRPLQVERLELESLFPGVYEQLSNANAKPLSVPEMQAVVVRTQHVLDSLGVNRLRSWEGRLGVAVAATQSYPAAQRYLQSQGRTAEEIDAMPILQVALMYELHNYDRLSDDLAKWVALPFWQGRAGMQKAELQLKQAKAAGAGNGTILATLLLPAVPKVQLRTAQIDRRIAGLRCVEAIRMYAAAHEGKLPDALGSIKEVPIPLDPITGRTFDYSVDGDRAVLSGPSPLGKEDSSSSVRYELTLKR